MRAPPRISNRILSTKSKTWPPRPSTPPEPRFESLPTELRLQIYGLLLDGKPDYCHFNRSKNGKSYSTPKLYPAILAVNRSISAEAYPILYGENTFLFLGNTRITDHLNIHHQFLGRLAGLPKPQKSSLLPKQWRHLIKHVAAAPLEPTRNDWVGQVLELAPATKTIEFDFWVGLGILNASIPQIKSLINASTQTFRIGIRSTAYHDSGFRFSRRKRVELPVVQLVVVDLKGLENVPEKSRMVHKALSFIIDIMGQRPPLPNNTIPLSQAFVSVEKRLLVHRDFAGFWSSDESTVPAENQGWSPVDTNGQIVKIGQECKSIKWRRSETSYVSNKALYGFSGW
ncbi:MAG: hypothetical protein Q9175_005640 [Cornicularia normoerica]